MIMMILLVNLNIKLSNFKLKLSKVKMKWDYFLVVFACVLHYSN